MVVAAVFSLAFITRIRMQEAISDPTESLKRVMQRIKTRRAVLAQDTTVETAADDCAHTLAEEKADEACPSTKVQRDPDRFLPQRLR
jgi:hypothetical protein